MLSLILPESVITTVDPIGNLYLYISLNITKGRMNALLSLQHATTITFFTPFSTGKLITTVTPSVGQFSEEHFKEETQSHP